MPFAHLALNPFTDKWVTEPRRSEPPVHGLNDRPLAQLLQAFAPLTAAAPPRPRTPPTPAQYVQSEVPGYGKSHLLGRFFREAGSRATRIYVKPFGAPETCWKSLLFAIVRELARPERPDAESAAPDEPDQFDAIANGVLAHLLATEIQSGTFTADADSAAYWRKFLIDHPHDWTAEGAPLRDWAGAHVDRIASCLDRQMTRLDTPLSQFSSARAWVAVLLAYARNRADREQRDRCLEWLKVMALEPADLAALGVHPADNPSLDDSAAAADDLCRHRVLDLCALAAFHRPFVLCFDQTEVYHQNPALALALGRMVSELVHNAPHQLTIVTANKPVWDRAIWPNIEAADRDRFSRPIELEGMNRAQARELALNRLKRCALAEADIHRFLDEDWITAQFQGGPQMPVRRFLERCEARWENPQPVAPPKPPEPVPDPRAAIQHDWDVMLAETRAHMEAAPTRIRYQPDVLQWAVTHLAQGAPGVPAAASLPNRLFPVAWPLAERRIIFGFEEGNYHFTWQRIAKAAREFHAALPTRAVVFRLPRSQAIPRPGWQAIGPQIRQAQQECLDILVLSVEDLAAIYAGHDLHAKACQGDLPHKPGDVLDFLRARLQPLLERFAAAHQPPAPPPGAETGEDDSRNPAPGRDLIRALEEACESRLFLTYSELAPLLQARLGRAVPMADAVEAAGFAARVRVYPHPENAVFQWNG